MHLRQLTTVPSNQTERAACCRAENWDTLGEVWGPAEGAESKARSH